MTITARTELIARLLGREGAVADLDDGKGETRWGQTPAWLAQFNLPSPQSADDAAENYAAWLAITGLDAVVSDTLDNAADFIIDFAVHSDHHPAIRAVQRVLGLVADGVVGPKTRAALEKVNREWLAYAVLAAENQYQGSLITNNPKKHARWAKGWANRQAAKLMQLAPARQ